MPGVPPGAGGAHNVVSLWETLLAQPEVEAVGLGARDSLRLEAPLCLCLCLCLCLPTLPLTQTLTLTLTPTLNPQPSTLNPQPSTLNPQP